MPSFSSTHTRPAALPARLYQRDVVQGMVPLTLVRVLREHLAAQGVPPEAVLPPDLLKDDADPLGRIAAETYCELLIHSAERLQDPLLGLHLGQTLRPTHLGALGYVLLACDNLGGALARIERYHRLVHDINPLQHLVQGEHLELQWGIAQGKPGALFDEVGVSAIVQFARDVCGQRLPLTQIDFVNPPPADPSPYTGFFGCPVRFGQPLTRLVIPLPCLMMPLRQPDATLRELMEAQVDAALAQLPEHGDLSDLTRRVVAHLAPQGLPTLEQVADELRLSPRIFYRRLAEQGWNFRDLRETTLRQVAEMHLRDPRLTLAEVGALLGYSEQSAFTRAFKRWTGCSPLNWRRRHDLTQHPPQRS
jgi:AraC-like DNA-binding protein